MSTFIDGIGQCQVVDKSGELVDLKGHDITSLPKTGTFTWEHMANSPATLVGKILEAKKIFSIEDCENDRQRYFWNKCKTPYLYVMGELLDDYTASARECAGQMKYSKDHPDQAPLLGFSIEGSEIPNTRKGMIITRSIGRKVTLTQSPCNSACIAEIYEGPQVHSQIKDEFDEIFKSKQEAMDLFKSGEGEKIYEEYLAKKENVKEEVPSDHKEAAEWHKKAVLSANDEKDIDHHIEQLKTHNKASLQKAQPSWSRVTVTKPGVFAWKHPMHGIMAVDTTQGKYSVTHNGGHVGEFSHKDQAIKGSNKYIKELGKAQKKEEKPLEKAIEAGSYNAAPSTLVNGSAYQTENLSSPAPQKKDWHKRAKEDYENWPHKEKFEKFMKARMPHLSDAEVKAIGKLVALKKSIELEKSIMNLISISKSEKSAKELKEKSLKEIQIETAKTWADRAEEAYKKAIEEKSVKWLLDADEYFHEAIEHSSLSEDLSTFEEIRAKLMPKRKEAFKLLAPDAEV